jgi:AraC family L-rhamnose operon transcriptional activator RhaR
LSSAIFALFGCQALDWQSPKNSTIHTFYGVPPDPEILMSQAAHSHVKGRELFEGHCLPHYTSRPVLTGNHVPHDHDFFEIALVIRGTGVHLSALGEQKAARGTGWILAPGAWHAYSDCCDLEVCNCCFGAPLLERELAALRHDAEANHLFFQGPLALERRGIIAFSADNEGFERIYALWCALNDANATLSRLAHLLLLLGEIAAQFEAPHRDAHERPPHPAALRAMQLLEIEMDKAWTLGLLAHELHIAPGYLARVFKAATGLAPIAWLHQVRAERAAQLLLQTTLPMAEIGARVGWDHPNLFARRFRAAFGVSASSYRIRFRSGSS